MKLEDIMTSNSRPNADLLLAIAVKKKKHLS
jgi:hypothetical protein